MGGGGQMRNRLERGRWSSLCLTHGTAAKNKIDTRISHTKHKIIDSIKETDTIRYLERKW